ncbi:MAG TPA: hypothetical protein VFS77_02215, partial [Pyrinomonadaceae bacterium]|nr:hypothetical protein [Pyrinomonadaceae bacterium]
TEKPWTEWTQKEAEKILNSSPWSQAQVDTDTSEMFFSPTNDPARGRTTDNAGQRLESGARNQAVNVKFIVRFFSARPVRQALVRMMELKQKPEPDVMERMHAFANVQSNDSIIMTLSFETTDQRYSGQAMQAMSSANTGTLKNETYLERDGKRNFLHEYIPPGKDGFGARFIFLRLVDEQPFIKENTGEVRFVTKYPSGMKVDRRFKVSDMIYNGQLEY